METLASYLARTKISKRDFAQRVGTSESSISRILNGKQRPSFMLLRRIKKATDGAVGGLDGFPALMDALASQEAAQ